MPREPAPGPGDSPYAPRPFRVVASRRETADTTTLRIAPVEPSAAFGFVPGQFAMVYAFGLGEIAVSIAGDPAVPGELTHTIRAVGRVSSALAALPPGEVLGVRGPYGTGWPTDRAAGKDVVIVAGGLGLPPLRGVLLELLRHRDRYGRVEVIYGARSPSDLVYYPEIQEWRRRPDLRVQVTVDAAGREWYGDVGVVTQRLPDARFDASHTVAMTCGPEIMMRRSAEALVAAGVDPAAIFLSLERNMKCAIAQCGHCQLGPAFLCREGPVVPYDRAAPWLATREL